MVRFAIAFVSMVLISATASPAGKPGEGTIDGVAKLEAFRDLFQTGDFYIGGQPNLETLRWLKSQGVTLVVNLRSENENKDFTAASFNEENVLRELGITYVPIPVGDKESYSPKTLDRFAQTIKANRGKALVHCASGVRATYLWMAYLVRYKGYALNDAASIGRQMKFTIPVEDFLGTRISLATDDSKR